MLLLLALLQSASAADLTQELSWDLTVEGKKVGERTLTVKYLPADEGMRRVLESTTHLDAQPIGLGYTFEQRLTAHAGEGPASFHSVVKDNGRAREIQGRTGINGWTVSVVERGRTRTWDLPFAQVDLSTADLLDPQTRVPLAQLETADMLSIETGDVMAGKVERLGTIDIDVDGKPVPVQGLEWSSDTGTARFYYTSDGVLVKYEQQVMGKTVQAMLQKLPPPGVDDAPITTTGSGIQEETL